MKKSEFEKIVTNVFWELESKFGFKKIETVFARKSAVVQFINATTDVTIHYEIGIEPWIAITDISNPENKSTLDWLLVELGIIKAPVPQRAFAPALINEQNLESILLQKKQQLLFHGVELLKGNFSIFPKLQTRAKKYEAECHRYVATHKSK